jgi:hypothetical protein
MAAEVRKAAGLKLAPASTAAAFAKSAIAERSKARRQQLETMTALVPAPAVAPVAVAVAVPVPAPLAERRPPAFPVNGDVQFPARPLPVERDIPVAPDIPMPAQEVEELGSDALADAPESIPPRPAGGFVLDPFAAATKLAQPQPPVPPPALPVPPLPTPFLVEPDVPPISGAPAFAAAMASRTEAAIDAPARPPGVPAKEASPSPPPARDSMVTDASIRKQADVGRRRKVLVLGSVGALGALILLLALARVALRDRTTHEVQAPAPSAAQVAPPTVSASPPPPDSTPVNASPSAPPAAMPPSAPPAPPSPPRAAPPPAPPPVAARPPPPTMHPQTPPPPPRPKKKPAFDPNSL